MNPEVPMEQSRVNGSCQQFQGVHTTELPVPKVNSRFRTGISESTCFSFSNGAAHYAKDRRWCLVIHADAICVS